MSELVNPPLVEHGFVQGRFVTAIADGLGDDDRYPDLRGISGRARFSPKQTITLFGGEYPATVTREPQTLDLNPQGWVVDASSKADPTLQPGAWLAVGRYDVETLFPASSRIPKFEINVTAEHNKANPLDLTLHAPVVLPPNTIEVTRVVDRVLAQQAASEALGFRNEAEQFAIAAGGGGSGGDGGSVSWANILNKPTEFPSAGHSHPEYLTAGDLPSPPDLSGFLTAEDLPAEPDLSGYVQTTDSRLSDARTPTAHSHPEYLTEEDLPGAPDLSGFVNTSDPRLSDARTPLAHTHEEYVQNGDVRLSDARTPLGHSHSITDVEGLQAALDDASQSGGGPGPVQALDNQMSPMKQLASTVDYGVGTSTWAVVSDSTGEGGVQWPRRFFNRVGALTGTQVAINYRQWDNTTQAWGANDPVVASGTGGTINVWNASRGGSTLLYHSTRIQSMFPSATPIDTLVISHGHNYDGRTAQDMITEHESFIAQFRALHPDVKILIASQNPRYSPAPHIAAHRLRNMELRRWAYDQGYEYAPVFERFVEANASGLVGSDGIHPSWDNGNILWADVYFRLLREKLFTQAEGAGSAPDVIFLQEGESVPAVTKPTLIVRY